MHGRIDHALTVGSRLLSTVTTQVGLHGNVALALTSCSLRAYLPTASQPLLSLSLTSGASYQTLSTSASPTASSGHGNNTLARVDAPSAQLAAPAAASSSAPLYLDGSRAADPGEPRYTAPYWIPEAVRAAHRLPAVLFTDPWPSHDERSIRISHAQACLQLLRQTDVPMSVAQVQEAVNARLLADHQAQQPGGGGNPSLPPPQPPLATSAYVRELLEHLRRSRMVYGIKNPESSLSAGHPRHPRLYRALPYQAARLGHPEVLAKEDAARREAEVEQAVKRLRRHKPPYAIHRRRARFSMWQHLQVQEAVQALQAR